MKDLAPIVLFTYNRLWHTQQTVASLKKNEWSSDSDLIIYSDGVRNDAEWQQVNEVRSYLKEVSGFKSVKLVESDHNKGLSRSIISGVTDVLEQYNKVIVLEDDMLTSPHFLTFMNDALELYKDVDEVACVHGYRYPIGQVEAPFFIRGADCWGWGTWKRAWSQFNKDGEALLHQLQERNLIADFNHQNSYPYDKMLKDQILGKIDSWAIRWKASAFLENQYTLYYKESLLRNIGNDDSGTHSQTTDHFDVSLADSYEGIERQEVCEDPEVMQKVRNFYRRARPKLWQRVVAKVFKK